MSTIEQFLSGACELDALSDAEKCAVCAAMEGEWVTKLVVNWYQGIKISDDFDTMTKGSVDDYLSDGTACLRLVERFGLDVLSFPKGWRSYQGIADPSIDMTGHMPTPSAAIVCAVCSLARAQYPYKVST